MHGFEDGPEQLAYPAGELADGCGFRRAEHAREIHPCSVRLRPNAVKTAGAI